MPGIFLNARDLQLLEGLTSYRGAWNRYDTLRDAIGKKPGQKITIPEYCKHNDVPIDLVCKVLKLQKTLQIALNFQST